jgi:hypothetical protein
VLTAALLSGGAFVAAQEPASRPAVAGKWTLTLETEAFTATSAIELKQDAEKITGTYHSTRYGPSPLEGKIVKGRALEFSVKLNAEGMEIVMAFSGEVAADGQTMKGRASIAEMGEATWSAKKEK